MDEIILQFKEFCALVASIDDEEVRADLEQYRRAVFAQIYASGKVVDYIDFFNKFHGGMTMAEAREEIDEVALGPGARGLVCSFLARRRALDAFVDVTIVWKIQARGVETVHPGPSSAFKKSYETKTVAPPAVAPFPHGFSICLMRLGPDPPAAVSAPSATTVLACDAIPGRPIRVWTFTDGAWVSTQLALPWKSDGEPDPRAILSVSTYGPRVVASTDDGRIYLWECKDGKYILRRRYNVPSAFPRFMARPVLRVWTVQFAPRGYLFASGAADGSVCVWSIDSPDMIHWYRAVGEPVDGGQIVGADVMAIAWDPSAQFLYAAPARRECLAWDVSVRGETRPIRSYHGSPGQIVSLCVGGGHLFGGGADGSIFAWNTRTGELVAKWDDDDYTPVYSITHGSGFVLATRGTRIIRFRDDPSTKPWAPISSYTLRSTQPCGVQFVPGSSSVALAFT
jgi:WD40 repeat protein